MRCRRADRAWQPLAMQVSVRSPWIATMTMKSAGARRPVDHDCADRLRARPAEPLVPHERFPTLPGGGMRIAIC